MLPEKIKLNYRIRKFIMETRKSRMKMNPLLTADYISEKIGRAKSWLSQIENGRLQSVKKIDLINAFCRILEKDPDYVEEYLDDHIQFIYITIKHNIIDENDNTIDFSEMLSFQQARGHLRFATKNLNDITDKIQALLISDIKTSLKRLVENLQTSVVYWINRAFSDTSKLFSDEISIINLYLLLETSKKILDSNYEYFGLNAPKLSDDELLQLKNKLNEDYVLKPSTVVKPLNEYKRSEIDKVIEHYSAKDYMLWKNKSVYIGNDSSPMLVNYKTIDDIHTDNFINYADVSTATGLSEEEYLYIIKQIYNQVDVLFKKSKYLLDCNKNLDEDNNELWQENESLKKEIQSLQKKLSVLSPE